MRVAAFGRLEEELAIIATNTVEHVIGDDEPGALASNAHVSQQAPLVDHRVVALHACVPDGPIKAAANVDQV